MSAPTAHLLHAIDPATGKPLEANKLKAEVAAFMAAGRAVTMACTASQGAKMVDSTGCRGRAAGAAVTVT